MAEIRAAIEAKAQDRKVSKALLSQLVLALDASRLPGLAFDPIVRQFREREIVWAASHGFAAVWLVGQRRERYGALTVRMHLQ